MIRLEDLMSQYHPGSYPQPWSWEDEEGEILTRECLCCGEPGHYQKQLEAHIREFGLTGGVCLGPDRVWDGHHRIVAARRLGITQIPLESRAEADIRWVRDHGPIDWVDRKTGDRLSWEQEWRKRRARGDFAGRVTNRLTTRLKYHLTELRAWIYIVLWPIWGAYRR